MDPKKEEVKRAKLRLAARKAGTSTDSMWRGKKESSGASGSWVTDTDKAIKDFHKVKESSPEKYNADISSGYIDKWSWQGSKFDKRKELRKKQETAIKVKTAATERKNQPFKKNTSKSYSFAGGVPLTSKMQQELQARKQFYIVRGESSISASMSAIGDIKKNNKAYVTEYQKLFKEQKEKFTKRKMNRLEKGEILSHGDKAFIKHDARLAAAAEVMKTSVGAARERPIIKSDSVKKMASKEKTLAAEAALNAGKYTAKKAEETSKKNASDISTNIVTSNYKIANSSSNVSNGGQQSPGPESNPAWSSIDSNALGGNI